MRLLVALILSLTCSGGAVADPVEETFRAEFSEITSGETQFAVGAAYAFGRDAAVTVSHGQRRKGSDQMVGPDAPWHIGSITKSITSTLVLRIAAREGFTVDTTLLALVPALAVEMHAEWHELTLRQLLSHTGGLTPNFGAAQMLSGFDADDLRAARLDRLRKHWQKPLPGQRGTFAYSNMGYVLAGTVMEELLDQSWEDLVRQEMATPLALGSLGFGPPKDKDAPWGHQSVLGMKFAKNPEKRGADNPAWLGPAGTVHMSLSDLVAWGQAHLAACRGKMPDFLSAEDCADIQTPIEADYGLGWVVERGGTLGTPVIWHNGSNTMWYAVLALVPEHDLAVAIATNRYDAAFGDAAMKQMIAALVEAKSRRVP